MKNLGGSGEMPQWVKVSVTKSNDSTSPVQSPRLKGRRGRLPFKLLSDKYTCTTTCINTTKNIKNAFNKNNAKYDQISK